MFTNPGKKLGIIGRIVFWLGAAASVLYAAFVVLVNVAVVGAVDAAWFEANGVTIGASGSTASVVISAALALALGLLASWTVSLVLCALGRLVENSEAIAAASRPQRPPIEAPQLRQTVK